MDVGVPLLDRDDENTVDDAVRVREVAVVGPSGSGLSWLYRDLLRIVFRLPSDGDRKLTPKF
jgi:hypothetical protein